MRRLALALAASMIASACTAITHAFDWGAEDGSVQSDGGHDRIDGGQNRMDGGQDHMDAGWDGGTDAGSHDDGGCTETTYYADGDGDGYGDPESAMSSCEPIAERITNAGDCDDGDGDVHPGVDETCDDADQDCDGAVDEGLMEPLGTPIELDRMSCCLSFGPTVVAHSNGFFVAWENPTDYRLHVEDIPLTGDPTGGMLGPPPASGVGQPHPNAIVFASTLVDETIVMTWQETGGVRAQIRPADGSAPLPPFFVTTDPDAGEPQLAIVGDRVLALWSNASRSNALGVRRIDPLLGDVDGSGGEISFEAADAVALLSAVGTSSSPPQALVSLLRFGASPVWTLGVLQAESSPVWDADSESSPSVFPTATTAGALLVSAEGVSGAAPVLGAFIGIDDGGSTELCFAPITPEGPSTPPEVGACTAFPYQPAAMAQRGPLASTLVMRGDTRLALLEYPIAPGPEGGTVVDLVDRSTSEGSTPRIATRSSGGIVVYEDRPDASTVVLLAQRFGCAMP